MMLATYSIKFTTLWHEDKLFTNVLNNVNNVLLHILPEHNNHMYNLRPRRHELALAILKAMLETFWKGNCSKTLPAVS